MYIDEGVIAAQAELARAHARIDPRRRAEIHPVDIRRNRSVTSPWRFDGERMPVRRAPTQFGERTHDVLQSALGLSDETLGALRGKGVFQSHFLISTIASSITKKQYVPWQLHRTISKSVG
ncbi:MAG TPA: hypothetical protein VJU59_39115 [Paraburkholderia sp.]|uniref:hypothetical protein n=1 Tax=Paraburkholderia sp. TaxID=1926495 RepID=UPI002B48F66C|nr:hypothetical protein [Paraburkholderia sp.]HKR45615.1 hypothetical protein [Paraburkholderia sp.]